MKQTLKKSVLLTLVFFSLTTGYGQNKVDVGLQMKTMHYWRGLKVTDAAMTGTSLGYFGDNFSAFAWGGLSFNGEYKEVTNVIKYSINNLSVTLTDIYNFSDLDTVEYFNYNKDECKHLVDLTVGYSFRFMNVSWSTILYGTDRTADNDQRFSTYVLFEFPFELDGVTLTPYVAPAFALNGNAEQMLYGDENLGVANIGLNVKRSFKVNELDFPVTATLGYNTILNQASIQLAIDLF
jgi:hypothetical protein